MTEQPAHYGTELSAAELAAERSPDRAGEVGRAMCRNTARSTKETPLCKPQEQPDSIDGSDFANSQTPLLKAECHRLIEAIARKPAATKLLLGCREMLQRFAQYKSNRNMGDRLVRPP